MTYLTVLLVALVMVTCADAHGRLISPPSRSSIWRYNNNIAPKNTDDMSLNCGGQGRSWDGSEKDGRGHCGVCGDPYNAVAPKNEAGGIYALGIIGARYTEGQTIEIVITITVAHGGWSEFRICPNNDIKRTVTQECLDAHLLKTVEGETRYYHPVRTGNFTVQLVLPKGLSCSQCVLQWWWKTNSNNNCRPNTGINCCIACGPQELFVNCADVAIEGSKPAVLNPLPLATRPPTPVPTTAVPQITFRPPVHITAVPPITYRPPVHITAVPTTTRRPPTMHNTLPENFIPFNNTSMDNGRPSTGVATGGVVTGVATGGVSISSAGFLPIDVGPEKCEGTNIARRLYGNTIADRWCQSQCKIGMCPRSLCNDACKN